MWLVKSLFTFAALDAGNIRGGFFFVLAITALAGIQRCAALVANPVKQLFHFLSLLPSPPHRVYL